MVVITGRSRVNSGGEIMQRSVSFAGRARLVHPLEHLALAAAGSLLEDAQIPLPAGTSDIGIYIGVDDSVEDIKDEYLGGILSEGLLGASPLLFPFTAPNALAARISIAFDLRGESITMPVNNSGGDVIKYSAECVMEGHAGAAVAGNIMLDKGPMSPEKGRYYAEFFFIEDIMRAKKRNARIYSLFDHSRPI